MDGTATFVQPANARLGGTQSETSGGPIMRTMRLPRRTAMAAAFLLAASPRNARAEWLPNQAIRILNGYPPGGSVDIVFRSVIPIDVDRDLTPVAALAGTPMALIARLDAPFSDLDGLARYARSRNGGGTFASSGNGSINQLAAAHLLHELGVEMTHVAYRGGAPAVMDVAARRVDIFMANIAEVAQLIRAGEVKALGITSATPVSLLPDLLPFAVQYPSLEINNWFGVAGPANLPDDIRAGLAALFAQALADPQTARTLRERGLEPMGESGEAFVARIRRDRERWRAVAIAGNIRSDG
jgi:tripartite-type tricarboxylate transporter receptor subunit TctC